MRYAQIVFMDGDEGREVVDSIERLDHPTAYGPTDRSVVEAVAYLVQWDMGEESEHDVRDSSSAGPTDRDARVDHAGSTYVLSWNFLLGHVALERII